MKMMAIGETWFLWMTGQLAIFKRGKGKKMYLHNWSLQEFNGFCHCAQQSGPHGF